MIFITLSEILTGKVEAEAPHGLRLYAVSHWFDHLNCVAMATTHPLNDPQDVINDKVALLDAAGTLMSGQGDTVRNIELLGTEYGHLSDCNVNTTMETIADSAIDLGLDLLTDNSAIWAQHTADDKDTAFMNLAEAHARNWLAAADAKSAARSYRCAREALAMVSAVQSYLTTAH